MKPTPAYCRGFCDGYDSGHAANPYDKNDKRHEEYAQGFKDGINHYVNEQ